MKRRRARSASDASEWTFALPVREIGWWQAGKLGLTHACSDGAEQVGTKTVNKRTDS